MNTDGWEDYDEGVNELLDSAWLVEWEEAAPSIADDPELPDTLLWPDEDDAIAASTAWLVAVAEDAEPYDAVQRTACEVEDRGRD